MSNTTEVQSFIEEFEKKARFLGSPSAEIMPDNDRIVELILLAQKVPVMLYRAKHAERQRGIDELEGMKFLTVDEEKVKNGDLAHTLMKMVNLNAEEAKQSLNNPTSSKTP